MMVRLLGLKKAITEYFRQETHNSARRLTSHEWTVTNEVSSFLDDVSEDHLPSCEKRWTSQFKIMVRLLGLKKAITEYFRQEAQNLSLIHI